MKIRTLTLTATALFGAASLAACGGQERKAESETPVAEAEVTTELPESVVPEPALEQAAENAADRASGLPVSPEADAAAMPTTTTTTPTTTTTTTQ